MPNSSCIGFWSEKSQGGREGNFNYLQKQKGSIRLVYVYAYRCK